MVSWEKHLNGSVQQRATRRATPTRRQALRLLGGGVGIALAGCVNQDDDPPTDEDENGDGPEDDDDEGEETNGNDAEDDGLGDENLEPPENGAVVFVYDDGPKEDYTKAFPVHQEFDAPATTGIITNRIGRSEDWMDVEQLRELDAAAWEICSHTTAHTPVAAFEIKDAIGVDDAKIHAAEYRHGHSVGKEVEITDGDRSVLRTVDALGSDPGDRRVALTEPVGKVFDTSEAVIRYPAEYMREALGESKRILEAYGFPIDTFLAPYDQFDSWSMEFIPDYYSGVANANHGERVNYPGFDPYETQRHYFIEFVDRSAVEADLDEIADEGALGVFGAHTFKDEVTQELIRETLEWVEDRGIEIMTLRDAFTHFT